MHEFNLYDLAGMTAKEQAQRIVEIYDDIEEGEPDISTERLLAMTADRMTHSFPECNYEFDVSDVCDALIYAKKFT